MAEDAFERNLQIIGEAANHLPADITDAHPEIAWPQIRGFRTCVLGKRTVIYGRNGSGKTRLTEALRLAGSSGKADAATLKVRVVTNGTVSTIDLVPGTTPFRLFVYDRYYVDESLRLFLD